MKREITKQEQKYINQLLEKRRERLVNNAFNKTSDKKQTENKKNYGTRKMG